MNEQIQGSSKTLWLRRAGVVGFLFFLGKGLVWLALFGWSIKTIGW